MGNTLAVVVQGPEIILGGSIALLGQRPPKLQSRSVIATDIGGNPILVWASNCWLGQQEHGQPEGHHLQFGFHAASINNISWALSRQTKCIDVIKPRSNCFSTTAIKSDYASMGNRNALKHGHYSGAERARLMAMDYLLRYF